MKPVGQGWEDRRDKNRNTHLKRDIYLGDQDLLEKMEAIPQTTALQKYPSDSQVHPHASNIKSMSYKIQDVCHF